MAVPTHAHSYHSYHFAFPNPAVSTIRNRTMPLALIVIYSMTLYMLLRMLDLECEPFHSYDNFGNGVRGIKA